MNKELKKEWEKLSSYAEKLLELSKYLSVEQKRDLEGLQSEIRRTTRNLDHERAA